MSIFNASPVRLVGGLPLPGPLRKGQARCELFLFSRLPRPLYHSEVSSHPEKGKFRQWGEQREPSFSSPGNNSVALGHTHPPVELPNTRESPSELHSFCGGRLKTAPSSEVPAWVSTAFQCSADYFFLICKKYCIYYGETIQVPLFLYSCSIFYFHILMVLKLEYILK